MAQQHRAWVGSHLATEGMAWVVVARDRTGGWCEFGAFLVDAWCLGVKDAYTDEVPAAEFDALLADQIPEDERESIEPACARRLVEDAVAYAQALGFLPHRDFRKARKVFGSLKSTDCAREFTFGREGRPCFMAGPDDDEARINRVLAILTARLGPEGFTFVDVVGEDAAETEEDLVIDDLYRFIEDGRCPDSDLTGFSAHGFITGLWIQPDLILPGEWQPVFWGGAAAVPVFKDKAEAGTILHALMTLYNRTGSELDEGNYIAGLPLIDDPDFARATREYATGLLRGLALRPDVLAWLRSHPDAKPAMELLGRCASGDVPLEDALETALVQSVEILRDIARELGRPPPAR